MNPNRKILIIVISIIAALCLISGSVFAYRILVDNNIIETSHHECTGVTCGDAKPVIYLYPTETENIKVELNYDGQLTSTYPEYDKNINGWDVIANPDGSLINRKDGQNYSYLFWEGIPNTKKTSYDTGFVVKGSDTKNFLQSTLKKIGLTAKEYNEMIVYWLPKMENNKFNLIHFAQEEYTDNAKLTITPTPDYILRVFMVTEPLDSYRQIPPQDLKSFERKGFVVIEWGGTELK